MLAQANLRIGVTRRAIMTDARFTPTVVWESMLLTRTCWLGSRCGTRMGAGCSVLDGSQPMGERGFHAGVVDRFYYFA